MMNPIPSCRTLTALLFLLVSFPLSAQTVYTVETIPNVKLMTNSYVSNPDGVLGPGTVSHIDQKLRDLEAQTTAQVAVVAVRSIGDADIFDFAQRLFTLWEIGMAKKDNGLLILLVVEKRTVRFHTGYGLEGVLPDATCKKIQRNQMVPSFRNENYDQGMMDGVDEVVYILSNPDYAAELLDDGRRDSNGWNDFFWVALFLGGFIILCWFLGMHWSRSFAGQEKTNAGRNDKKDKKEKKVSKYPEMKLTHLEWLTVFAVAPMALLLTFNFLTIDTENHILIFLILLYGYLGLTLLYKRIRMKKVTDKFLNSKDYSAAAVFFNDYQVYWLVMAILIPLPGLVLYLHYNTRKKYFRNHPRNCKSCGQLIQSRLDEKADDLYLQKSQVFEEELKSVDYDVWLCTSCKSVEVFNFTNRFSKYDPCPYCSAKAFYLESDRTITSATYTSTGTGQKTHKCKFCTKSSVSTYTIPMLTKSEDSDSSSSSSGSSSGGGSWGGGSSGGGGASSSW